MQLWISGGTATERRLIADAADQVGAVLPWDGEIAVTVGSWQHASPSSEAMANHEGVWIKPATLRRGPPGRAQYILYEEFAHYVLGQMGVEHGTPMGVFFQELFAAYLQFTLLRRHQVDLLRHLEVHPVPRGGGDPRLLLHDLGRHIGAALSGEHASEQMLFDWLDDEGEDSDLRRLASAVLAEFREVSDAQELADACVSNYRGITADAPGPR